MVLLGLTTWKISFEHGKWAASYSSPPFIVVAKRRASPRALTAPRLLAGRSAALSLTNHQLAISKLFADGGRPRRSKKVPPKKIIH